MKPRIRTVKPELFLHEGLFDLEKSTGLPIRCAWSGLFTVADREGRFLYRPRTIKAHVLPHDDLDFSRVLDAFLTAGFIVRYRVGVEWFGWIPTFSLHQVINNRESASDIPSIDTAEEVQDYRQQAVSSTSVADTPRVADACSTRDSRQHGPAQAELELELEQKTNTGAAAHSESDGVASKRRVGRDRFVPPTADEVATYIAAKGYGVDAETFVATYARQGWKLANGRSMVDWKMAVVTWEKKRHGHHNHGNSQRPGGHLRHGPGQIYHGPDGQPEAPRF